jgi:hypothetical protein
VHAFALAVAKPGRTVPRTVAEVLDERSPSELTFDAQSHVRWSDSSGRTAYGGWQIAADHFGVGSHWEVRGSGLTAFSGQLWKHGVAWASGATWASQLADRFERVPLHASLDDYQGVYTAVSVSADGSGCVASDPLAFGALYWAESDDVVVVSTSSALAARVMTRSGHRPRRNALGVASIAYCHYVIGNYTGFEGVETIPPGSYLELTAGGAARIRAWAPRPWLPMGDERVDDLAALVREVRDELAAAVRVQAQVPARALLANITGGRDSRLVLALMLSEGITDQFVFNTFGSPQLPDTIVATAIADRFGLDHRAATRPAPSESLASAVAAAMASEPVTYEQRIRDHLWVTSGLLSIWDLRGWSRTRSPDLVITGLFGESLRTIYPGRAGIESIEQLVAQVSGRGFNFDPAKIFKPDARKHLDAAIEERLIEMQPEGGTPQDALDGFYLSGRLRRWFGPQPDSERLNRTYPLYSIRAIRAAYALGAPARRAEILGFEVMRASCDELATMPFSAAPWPEAAIAHLPDADRYRTVPATPKVDGRKPPTRTVNRDNQDRAVDERIPVLRAQLEELDPRDALFDVIDRPALIRGLDDFNQLGYRARRSVQSAVAAAMWMNHAEAPYKRAG